MATIYLTPYVGNNPKTEYEVKMAWLENRTFSTPQEFNSCMSRHDWQKYGNKLDSVTYESHGLIVNLEQGIL